MNSIKFNGKEVENPLARGALLLLVILITLGLVAFLLFFVLPFVGIVISGTLGIVLLVLLTIVPLVILKKLSGEAGT